MRKFLIFCLSLVSVIALALGTTGCMVGDWFNQTFCEHEFNEGEVTTPATCSEFGVLTKTCNLCGYTEDSEIEKVDHVIVTIDTVPAECNKVGYTSSTKCKICDEYIVAPQEIPATGHKEVIDEAVAPTCLESGLTEGSHCEKCGEIFAKQVVVPATGHNMVVMPAVEPTCFSTGLTAGVKCSLCDEIFTAQEEIPALQHIDTNEDLVCDICGYNENNPTELMSEVDAVNGESVVGKWFRIYRSDMMQTTLTTVKGSTNGKSLDIMAYTYDQGDYGIHLQFRDTTVFNSGPNYKIEGLLTVVTDEYIDIYFEEGTFNVVHFESGEIFDTITINETVIVDSDSLDRIKRLV